MTISWMFSFSFALSSRPVHRSIICSFSFSIRCGWQFYKGHLHQYLSLEKILERSFTKNTHILHRKFRFNKNTMFLVSFPFNFLRIFSRAHTKICNWHLELQTKDSITVSPLACIPDLIVESEIKTMQQKKKKTGKKWPETEWLTRNNKNFHSFRWFISLHYYILKLRI